MIRQSFSVAAFAAMCVIGSPAAAQDAGEARSTIVVQGRGVVERAPDSFYVTGELVGSGRDQVAALQGLADVQSRLTDQLTRLDGLTDVQLLTTGVGVNPVYDRSCTDRGRDAESAGCEVSGHRATLRFTLKAKPASEAGNAVSLAAELGARSVGSSDAEIDDPDALRREAGQLAFQDAREQAELLAAAGGRRLGRIVRIQNADARVPDDRLTEVEEVVVTGSRVRPSVAIPVNQEPVRIEARVNVVFEIE